MAIANVLHPPGILASNTVFSIPSPAESPRATRQEDDDMGHEGLRAEEDDAGDDLGAHGSLVMREKTCPTCGRVFKKQSRLTQHLLTHGDDRPFACPVPGCGKAYKRQEHLKNHATSHGSTDEERKPYVCEHEGCTAAFSNPHHLKRHEKAHAEGGIYKCDVEDCGQAFAKQRQLLDHREVHVKEGTVVLGHPCPVEGCQKVFPTPSKLAKHSKTHDASHSYACGHANCTQTFSKWTLLQQHLRNDHPITCPQCQKTFTRRETLKNHMKIHDVDRELFPCNWPGCTKVLTSKKILNVHIQASHEGVKRFECHFPECGSKFAHKHLLVRHQRTHEKKVEDKPKKSKKRTQAQILTGHKKPKEEAGQQPL